MGAVNEIGLELLCDDDRVSNVLYHSLTHLISMRVCIPLEEMFANQGLHRNVRWTIELCQETHGKTVVQCSLKAISRCCVNDVRQGATQCAQTKVRLLVGSIGQFTRFDLGARREIKLNDTLDRWLCRDRLEIRRHHDTKIFLVTHITHVKLSKPESTHAASE